MTAQGKTNPPVITNAFASGELAPGETWKIFLQAEDPDGDMVRIICTFEQPGGGVQPAAFIKIREDRRRNLSGYIFLNTAEAPGQSFAGGRLTVQIQDRKGALSNSESFAVDLNPRALQKNPPPGVFRDENLGPVQLVFPAPPGP